jgi:type III pantothenate kinase
MYKLTIDIGNSYTHLGIFSIKLVRSASFSTEETSENDIELAFLKLSKGLKINKCAISSVVPEKEKFWSYYIEDTLNIIPLIINNKIKLPVRLKVKNSSTLGADRICNAVCGYDYFKKKSDVIVIDMGTAITLDVVKKNGDFVGGIIMPGIWTSAKSLFVNTGKLPLITEQELSFPPKTSGNNTIDAIKSGLMNSALFAIEGYVRSIKEEFRTDFKIILSGGIARLFHKKLSFKSIIIKNTVLEGLNIILGYNSKK